MPRTSPKRRQLSAARPVRPPDGPGHATTRARRPHRTDDGTRDGQDLHPAGRTRSRPAGGQQPQARTQLVTRSRPATVCRRRRRKPAGMSSTVNSGPRSGCRGGRRGLHLGADQRGARHLGDQVTHRAALGHLQLDGHRPGLERDQPHVALAPHRQQAAAVLGAVPDQLGQLLVQPAQPEQRPALGQHLGRHRVELVEHGAEPDQQRPRRSPRVRSSRAVPLHHHGALQQRRAAGSGSAAGWDRCCRSACRAPRRSRRTPGGG